MAISSSSDLTRSARRAACVRVLGVAALSLPAMMFLALMLLFPLSRFVAQGLEEGGFGIYRDVVTDAVYLRVFVETFAIAAAATVLSIVIAYPLAHFLATTGGVIASLGFFFVLLPFWTSIVVRTYRGWCCWGATASSTRRCCSSVSPTSRSR